MHIFCSSFGTFHYSIIQFSYSNIKNVRVKKMTHFYEDLAGLQAKLGDLAVEFANRLMLLISFSSNLVIHLLILHAESAKMSAKPAKKRPFSSLRD